MQLGGSSACGEDHGSTRFIVEVEVSRWAPLGRTRDTSVVHVRGEVEKKDSEPRRAIADLLRTRLPATRGCCERRHLLLASEGGGGARWEVRWPWVRGNGKEVR
jgi:hypothetical protein